MDAQAAARRYQGGRSLKLEARLLRFGFLKGWDRQKTSDAAILGQTRRERGFQDKYMLKMHSADALGKL